MREVSPETLKYKKHKLNLALNEYEKKEENMKIDFQAKIGAISETVDS